MKYSKRIILFVTLFLMFIYHANAATIRETVNSNDGYDTIEPNTFIIGITKFSGNEIITASKAATAGANDAVFYASKNGTAKGYQPPVIYLYLGSNIGWFAIDQNNNASAVTDNEIISKLSNRDIYYVSNVEKKVQIQYYGDEINLDSLNDGVEYKDSQLVADATLINFQFETNTGKTINYSFDETTSTYIEDLSHCYVVQNGIILDYDRTCRSDVVIPSKINNEEVTAIGENAFNNKNISSLVIPSNITSIGDNAFLNNNISNVTIKDKYDLTDFAYYGNNIFPESTEISYENDLTNALKSIQDNYTIKIYSSIDMNDYKKSAEFSLLEEQIEKTYNSNYTYSDANNKLYSIFENNLDNNQNIDSNYNDGKYNWKLTIQGDDYYLVVYKDLENDRHISESKKIEINYEKTGTITTKLFVDNVVEEIPKTDDPSGYWNISPKNYEIVTRRKYIEDTMDNNNLDFYINIVRGNGPEHDLSTDIGHSLIGGNLFIFKDDILYYVNDNFGLLGVDNEFVPGIKISDYNDDELLMQDLLSMFELRTGLKNYNILLNQDNKQYTRSTIGTSQYFSIKLFDKDNLEYWTINASEAA